jgi:hypothetical protein
MEESIVLKNSPVEFVITGPSGGRDQVLIKSDNAGLDLIGVSAELGYDSYDRKFGCRRSLFFFSY